MYYKEYRKEVDDAMTVAEIEQYGLNESNAKFVVELLSNDVLAAVVNGRVLEDYSVITNNEKFGKPQPFLEYWVVACDLELVERLLTGGYEEG